jgi:hypothetical protein
VHSLSPSHSSSPILHSSVMLICYTKVAKKFYSLRSSFHAETCESPTLSGVVTAPNSETLMADVLSFLTVGKEVLCQSWASGFKVFRSKQRTEKHSQTHGCCATILNFGREKVKVKLSRYRSGVAQRVPGS